MKNVRFIIITAAITVLSLSGCSQKSEHLTRTALYFDTAVTIDLYGPDEVLLAGTMDECIDLCSHYEKLFNKNDKDSDIAAINSSSGKTVAVDHDTALLIKKSLYYCDLSGGLFDITIKPVSDLWVFHAQEPVIPKQSDIDKARALIDYKSITVDTDDDTVTVSDNAAIDPGGAAKGYIADLIAEHISGSDVTGAIINIGGDMRIIGEKSKDTPFTVGIRDPFDKNNVMMPLMLSDCAIATSGTYERCFTANGQRYHHIIDPSTGYSAQTDIESVTVITKDALGADCLGTVCILLKSNDAMDLIEDTKDTEAIFILSDGSVLYTSGANAFLRQ